MSLCIVGTVALDSLESPYGSALDALGGSGTFSSLAASYFGPVRLVSIVGSDFPAEHLDFLASRGINTAGITRDAKGSTFRWKGRYGHDMDIAETLETHLGVLASFRPQVPAEFHDSTVVFLANISPGVQSEALDRVKAPRFVAADTMNFWISNTPDELRATLRRVSLLCVNEGEARMLTGEPNLAKAARLMMALGPRAIVIKGGEFGATLFTEQGAFCAPALPNHDVVDPTGAGDSFAGGMMGYLAATGKHDDDTLRTAVIVGSVMASYAIERFGTERYRSLTHDDIRLRFKQFRELTRYNEFGLPW